jgi:hypothetical protein
LEFEPTLGWQKKLGNKHRERIINNLKAQTAPIYIFGAGANGIYAYNCLISNGLKVSGFIDNNNGLWGKDIVLDTYCTKPESIENGSMVVVGMKDKYNREIKEQLARIGGVYAGTINYIN